MTPEQDNTITNYMFNYELSNFEQEEESEYYLSNNDELSSNDEECIQTDYDWRDEEMSSSNDTGLYIVINGILYDITMFNLDEECIPVN